MVAQPTPFFIVFDTCTHARYYSDVHEVLAMPAGGIIRYEYKRSLFKPDAAAALDALCVNPSSLPIGRISPSVMMSSPARSCSRMASSVASSCA
jgi:hypothetical protein